MKKIFLLLLTTIMFQVFCGIPASRAIKKILTHFLSVENEQELLSVADLNEESGKSSTETEKELTELEELFMTSINYANIHSNDKEANYSSEIKGEIRNTVSAIPTPPPEA